MALTREQAMGMLFAPPWAPGTYDDATIWNDAHRKYPPANVPVGVPVDTRDALTAQLMQQPQSSPFGTGDTIRYPGGLAGGLGGAAENPIGAVNNSLDLGGTPAAKGGGGRGGLSEVFGDQPPAKDPVEQAQQPEQQPEQQAPEQQQAQQAPAVSHSTSTALDPPTQSIPNIAPKDPYDPSKDTNTPPSQVGVSKGAPQLGSRGVPGVPLDPNAVPDLNPPGVTVSTVGPLGVGQKGATPPGYVDTQPAVNAQPGKADRGDIAQAIMDQQPGLSISAMTAPALGQSRGFGDVPAVNAPMSAPEVVTDISQIGLSPAQQSVLDNNFGLSALGKGTETNNPGISSNPTIGVTSTQQANPTSLAQDLATQFGISTPASNNFGLAALGTSALAPTAAPAAVAAPEPPSAMQSVQLGLNDLNNAIAAMTNSPSVNAQALDIATSMNDYGTTAPAADPSAPDATAASGTVGQAAASQAQADQAQEADAAVGAALDAMGATGAPGDNAGGIGDPGTTASYGDLGFGYGFGLGDTPGFADAPSAPDAPDSTSESDE